MNIDELIADFENWLLEEYGFLQYKIDIKGGTYLDSEKEYFIYCYTRKGKQALIQREK